MKVFEVIKKDLVNINPEDDKGQTPLPDSAWTTLQIAAQIGLVYIYKKLMENLDNKILWQK